MTTKSKFDAALRSAASSGEPLPPLDVLMRRTMTTSGKHQLAATTLVSDLSDPGAAIAEVAGHRLDRFTTVERVSILEMAHPDQHVVSLWPSDIESVWHVISTIPVTDRRWQKVQRLIQRTAPAVSTVYLDEHVLPALCGALSKHGPVLASRMTARITFDGSSYSRGWKDNSPVTRPSFREAIEEVQDFGTIRTLTVTVGDDLTVHLRRSAGSTYYAGNPRIFTELVLHALAKAAGEKAALFRGRERQKHEPLPDPIAIQLRAGHFSEVERLSEVVEMLDKVSGMGVAVLHGNPYLHVVVTDYRDGSSFDLIISRDDRIEIYPGFRGSLGSLARLTDAIGENIAAVSIEILEPRQLTSDDFFASA